MGYRALISVTPWGSLPFLLLNILMRRSPALSKENICKYKINFVKKYTSENYIVPVYFYHDEGVPCRVVVIVIKTAC